MTTKLTRIDGSILDDHTKLVPADECYFWREYTSGRDYRFGPGNDLISNLKKRPTRSSAAELRHKSRVIAECSAFFRQAIDVNWLADATLVPIPGSKASGDPDFDDRMTRIIDGIRPGLDIRHLVYATASLPASHECAPGERPTVEQLAANYALDEALATPTPTKIGIFDDVLTAGVHYRAVHNLLRTRFPNCWIVGFFVARRIFPPDDE